MKKGWKIFWIVCASVFGVGVVLCICLLYTSKNMKSVGILLKKR